MEVVEESADAGAEDVDAAAVADFCAPEGKMARV
jgi:hypothetical protein